ncbi:MAG: helicase-exonuclease AddAB subunit AddA [Limosilactobacillus sp.]|uniref:helicase-exonuclease AddAB subunit AddA n=1 Tax=Limosilactobacillus sp. TaxID=2773925 RepID=UPI0026F8B9D6|nr:helicase-exonuclease AddAB subunit AddA [Limosilactobacillus sp.]
MGEIKFTDSQQSAIDERNKNILVSASAGSGKTAVLVNRAIKLIKEGNADVDRIMMATFTDPAAKNMKDRIRKSLLEALEEEKDSAMQDRLKSQINRLPLADISTLHSFCSKLIKRYYFLIDLDPQFRLISDDTEKQLIKEDVLSQLEEDLYAKSEEETEDMASFGQLARNFSGEKNDNSLTNLILNLYEKASIRADSEDWLKSLPAFYDMGDNVIHSAIYQKQIKPVLLQELGQLSNDFKQLSEEAGNYFSVTQNVLYNDYLLVNNLLSFLIAGSNTAELIRLQVELYKVDHDLTATDAKKKSEVYTDLNDEWAELIDKWEIDKGSLKTIDQARSAINQLVEGMDSIKQKSIENKFGKTTKDYLDSKIEEIKQIEGNLFVDVSWNDIRQKFNDLKFDTIKGPKKDEEFYPQFVSIKEKRDQLKKQFNDNKKYWSCSQEELIELSTESKRLVNKLVQVVLEFGKRYQQYKLNRHMLDFNDLEHYAYQILNPPADNKEWTDLVANLRNHYQQIMVDEYQDTNPIQESILNSLADPEKKNLFMVGDVKQSIYRFRGGDSTIFTEKFKDYKSNKEHGENIVLAENFRSMKNVVNFTNLLFKQLMDSEVGEIDYDEDAYLKFAAKYYGEENSGNPTEVMIYDANAVEKNAILKGVDSDGKEDEKLTGEVRMIGMRIKQMVKNKEKIIQVGEDGPEERAIQYGDIAILSRTKSINSTLMEEFAKLDIPLYVKDVQSYFQTTEVRIMLSLLKLVDNPEQDIPLAAVLRSPIVGLTTNEFAFINLQNTEDNYFSALKSFANNYLAGQLRKSNLLEEAQIKSLYEKIMHFLEQLNSFRQIAQQQSIVDLIWTIYNETGYLDYVGAMPGGPQRQANLHALYLRAKQYEESSFKGVYQFVRFVQKLQEHDKDLGVAQAEINKNSVNVMTIHSSKGLEFPVVFLVDSDHETKKDYTDGVLVNDNMIGIDYITQKGDKEKYKYLYPNRVKYGTLQKQVVSRNLKKAQLAEDLRILYVAVTRAQQRLIITASYNETGQKNGLKPFITNCRKARQSESELIGTALRIKADNLMYLIGLALARSEEFENLAINDDTEGSGDDFVYFDRFKKIYETPDSKEELFKAKTYTKRQVEKELEKVSGPDESVEEEQDDKKVVADLSDLTTLLNHRYAHSVSTMTTAYQSVSEVKHLFEYPDSSEESRWNYGEIQPNKQSRGVYLKDKFEEPEFLKQTETEPPAAKVGTATHLVFQKVDLTAEGTSLDGVKQTGQSLVAQGLITEAESNKIDYEGISGFFQTEIGQEILANPNSYHREEPFAMIMNGNELFQDIKSSEGEQILVHGIIDGYLEDDEGKVTLIDYKTDEAHNKDIILARYAGQLNLYDEALKTMGKTVVRKALYLVKSKDIIPVV